MKKLLDLIESEQRCYTHDYLYGKDERKRKEASQRILALDILLYKAVELQTENQSKYDKLLNGLHSIIADINSMNNISDYVQFDTEALIERIYHIVTSSIDEIYLIRDGKGDNHESR